MKAGNKKAVKLLAVGLLLVFLAGCASFRGNNLEPIANWPPAAGAKKKSISVVTKGFSSLNGGETKVALPQTIDIWNNNAVKAYTDSALFSQVMNGTGQTDLQAEIEVMDKGEGSMAMAVLTGLTLYVIPSTATDTFTLKTTIRDSRGRVLGQYEKTESVILWQQLFLIFAMPFKFPVSVVNQTLYDINRATINAAHAQGVI